MVNHPQVRLAFVHSTSNAGNRIADVHGGLEGDTELRFADTCDLASIDVLFLCSAHGESRKWLEANDVPAGVKIIDLAQDFRDESDGFVYGLPELNRDPHPHGGARRQSGLFRHGDPACACCPSRRRAC